jgi:hypothetical protein
MAGSFPSSPGGPGYTESGWPYVIVNNAGRMAVNKGNTKILSPELLSEILQVNIMGM